MKYSVGLNIDGLNMVDIEAAEISNLKDETIVLYLGEESSKRLYSYYVGVRGLLVRGNRIITLVGEDSKIQKQICMLLVTYDNYDIYEIDGDKQVDLAYVTTLQERQPTVEEIELFIGSDISAYGELNTILAQMSDLAKDNNIDGLTKLVCDQVLNLESAVNVVDYIKRIADTSQTNLSTVVGQMKENIGKLSSELDNTKSLLNSAELELSRYKSDVADFKADNNSLKRKYADLEEKMGKSGQVIRSYTSLNTSIIKCKVQSILYFKEISKPAYINTFITQLFDKLTKIEKLSVKLVIYDNNVKYNIYKPLSIVDSNFYMQNKESVIERNPKMVVTEPNENLLEAIVKHPYDVVIIYDRLGQKDDIISGNQVYKFYTAASRNDAEACKKSDPKATNDRIIGHANMMEGSLGLQWIEEYNDKASDSKKLLMYLQMENVSNGLNVKIIDYVMSISNIDAIIANRSKK